MTEERKTIKDLTDLDLKDLVDRLIPECQGKVQDIRRDGIPLAFPSSMPPAELFRFLIYTWLLERQEKGELGKAPDIVQKQMWDGSFGFKLHADEELVKDLVRAGFVFDAQLGLFLRPIPMTEECPLPDWMNPAIPTDPSEQAKVLREADRLTNGRFGDAFHDAPTDPLHEDKEKRKVSVTSFSLERHTFGHGDFGYVIKANIAGLKPYDDMDEKIMQKAVDELNAQLAAKLPKE